MKMFKRTSVSVLIITMFLAMQLTSFAVNPFLDVNKDSWYSDAVDYVYNNGLMSGIGSNQFAPDANMSRSMLVTVLYSMEGKPTARATEPFDDVGVSNWYYNPVVWAYENGIVAGTSATKFSPDDYITREQMVAIFAKYAAYKDLKTPATANLNSFVDNDEISAYAVNAFKWAIDAKIVSGTTATNLSPQGSATRAQCAVILQQFKKWIVEAEDVIKPELTPGFDYSGDTPED